MSLFSILLLLSRVATTQQIMYSFKNLSSSVPNETDVMDDEQEYFEESSSSSTAARIDEDFYHLLNSWRGPGTEKPLTYSTQSEPNF